MARSPYGVLIVHGFTSSLDCVSCLRPPIEALGLPTRMPILRGHGAESPQALCGVTWREWVVLLLDRLDDAAPTENSYRDMLIDLQRDIDVRLDTGSW